MYGHDILKNNYLQVNYSTNQKSAAITKAIEEVEENEAIQNQQSISEGVEEKVEKKIIQSSSKQTYSKALDRTQYRGKKAYHGAFSAHFYADKYHEEKSSPSNIKFGLFSFISPYWLGHRKKKINVKFAPMIKALPPQRDKKFVNLIG